MNLGPEYGAETVQRFEKVRREVGRLATQGADPYLRAFYGAFGSELSSNYGLVGVVYEAIETINRRRDDDQKPASSTEVAYYLQKSHQALEQKNNSRYPEGQDNVEAVRPSLRKIVEDEEYQASYLMNMMWPIASNVADRGKLLKAALMLSGKKERWDILDFGCSFNHVLKKLALSDAGQMTFPATQVREWDQQKHKLVANPGHSSRINQLIRKTPLNLGFGLGVDLRNYDTDPEAYYWGRSNSHRPGEIKPDKIQEFDQLMDTTPPNVGFLFEDVTSPKLLFNMARNYPKNPYYYDAVNVSFMLYGQSARDCATIIMNAQNHLKDDGLIVVTDSVDLNDEGQIVFHDPWRAWKFSVLVWNGKDWKKYFSIDSGRAKQIKLEPAIGELATARELGLIPSGLAAA